MKRYYLITWFENKNKIERTNKIVLGHPRGKVEVDAQAAADLFVKSFGNLKKNTIISIKEFDENDNQIGEDIKPSVDAVVPIKRKK